MSDEIPDRLCLHCLPDCGSTDYKAKVFVNPFPQCDVKTLGGSKFCDSNFKRVSPFQEKLRGQIINEYLSLIETDYYYDLPEYLDLLFEGTPASFNEFDKKFNRI